MTRCPRCGSTDLVGGRYFVLITDRADTLRCACGAGGGGVAAVRRSRQPVALKEWGHLDGDGNWATECVEPQAPAAEETERVEVLCPACVAVAEPGDWRGAPPRTSEDRSTAPAPFLGCAGCGAEHVIG